MTFQVGMPEAAFAWAIAALVIAAGAFVASSTGRFRVEIRDTHVLPVIPQTLILAYWMAYWSDLRAYVPVIVVELALAVALDAYLSWWMRGTMVLGVGFVPIVLSLNLIAQFPPDRWWSILLAPTIAILAKYVPLRDGRHIFNPSAIAITIVGFVFVAMGERAGDVSHAFGAPPSMVELILLVALLPQFRRPIVLVSLGAWLGNVTTTTFGKLIGMSALLSPLWAPVLLTHVLLATDPATTPRTGPGRLLFGIFVGAAEVVAAYVLSALIEWDYLAKVVAIPVANVLVPRFDTMGARWAERSARLGPWLAPERNVHHMAAWATLMFAVVVVGGSKAHFFVVEGHRFPLAAVRPVADPARACEENPAFCRPFPLTDELRLWTRAGVTQER